MDERFSIEGDPETVLGALLAVDPEGNCPRCGHALRVHRSGGIGAVCEIENCECRGAQVGAAPGHGQP
jgi:hypothetical protein